MERARIGKDDRMAWIERIHVLPFDRAEVFVYILERLPEKDILYLNENLKEKISAAETGGGDVFEKIFEEEKLYLRH